jgi:hypothetical protein
VRAPRVALPALPPLQPLCRWCRRDLRIRFCSLPASVLAQLNRRMLVCQTNATNAAVDVLSQSTSCLLFIRAGYVIAISTHMTEIVEELQSLKVHEGACCSPSRLSRRDLLPEILFSRRSCSSISDDGCGYPAIVLSLLHVSLVFPLLTSASVTDDCCVVCCSAGTLLDLVYSPQVPPLFQSLDCSRLLAGRVICCMRCTQPS